MINIELPINYDNISFAERRAVRNEYIKRQDGKCFHCKESLSVDPPSFILKKYIIKKLFPIIFFKFPAHLHHNHNTGLTIGAVHNYCNAVAIS